MPTHKLENELILHFDDGSKQVLPFPKEHVYYYREQKHSYWIGWIEAFMREHPEIKAKPIYVEEATKIVECEPYNIYIGL